MFEAVSIRIKYSSAALSTATLPFFTIGLYLAQMLTWVTLYYELNNGLFCLIQQPQSSSEP